MCSSTFYLLYWFYIFSLLLWLSHPRLNTTRSTTYNGHSQNRKANFYRLKHHCSAPLAPNFAVYRGAVKYSKIISIKTSFLHSFSFLFFISPFFSYSQLSLYVIPPKLFKLFDLKQQTNKKKTKRLRNLRKKHRGGKGWINFIKMPQD